MIPVACCIIRNENGQILLAQKNHGGWEFPGGKQHDDETLFQCAEREILEELGIIINPISAGEHTYITGEFELVPVICDFIEGNLALTEHLDASWIDADQVAQLDLCTGDRILWEAFQGGV
ncbi:MAG: NUDIX domain-containing protein [Bacteroidota bacterium]